MTFSGAERAFRAALCLLLTFAATPALGGGPENVLVVVNGKSALSRNIAEYYARRRAIPKTNVCSIHAPDRETISRQEYDSAIAGPVAACLRSKGLVQRVLYIVTTQGVPLRVKGEVSRTGDNASVDSELTQLYAVLHGRVRSLAGPAPNPFFRQHDASFRHPQFPIYLVTRLAAYDLQGVKSLIDRSLAAKDRGKFILDLRKTGDPSGDEWLRNAAILLPANRVVLEESTTVAYGKKGVIGYASWGSNDPQRKNRKLGFEWLPGAIATEYVSTNGRTFARPPADWQLGSWGDTKTWFAGAPQTLAADLIAEGVTGVAAHVDEPYLAFTPRPDYLLPAYASGRNLAESYYLAMPVLSWQNIVIGDPLCALL